MASSRSFVFGASVALIVGACSLVTDTGGLAGSAQTRDGGDLDAPPSGDAPNDGPRLLDDGAARRGYADIVLADAPLAYYRLDEAAGPTLHDASGHGKDASGSVGIQWSLPGAIVGDANTAVHLDGSDCIHAGNEFDFAGRQPYSLEMWVKPEIIDDTFRMLFVKDLWSTNKREEYGLYLYRATGLVFERYVQGAGIAVSVATSVTGQWMHVVATYDGSVMSLYRDGKLQGVHDDTRDQATKPVGANIGCASPGASAVKGAFDEVAVYDHPLTALRVLAHFEAGTH